MPNGVPSNAGVSSNMMPKGYGPGQMPAGLGAGRGLGNSPEHMRIFYEANRLQQQQVLMLAARQAHQQQQANATANSTGQHSSPNLPNAAMVGSNASSNSPAFMAAVTASNGVPSPSAQMAQPNGATNAASPRIPNGHTLSSGVTPAITQLAANIQRMNPDMPPEEVQRLATSQLMTRQAQHVVSHQKSMNQAALNAAAGAANAGAHAANASSYNRTQGMMTNEQVQAYNVQLRQQQAVQRANGYGGAALGAGLGMNMNGNMGPMGGMPGFTGSPGLSMSRPVSNHTTGQMSRSATPREQRAGSNGMGVGSPRPGQGPMS